MNKFERELQKGARENERIARLEYREAVERAKNSVKRANKMILSLESLCSQSPTLRSDRQ